MESLIRYEGLAGKVQMVCVDPPYGIGYDSNFQQRVDASTDEETDRADDVLTIRAFRARAPESARYRTDAKRAPIRRRRPER